MPSLKDLKNRISSVKSTRKITSAMKMVAASKFRRAQEQALAARPYAEKLSTLIAAATTGLRVTSDTPRLLTGTGQNQTILLLVATSDRGLCGAFNGNVVRETRHQIRALESEGKKVKLYFVGRKGRDLLRRDHADKIVGMTEASKQKHIAFSDANALAQSLLALFNAGEFDVLKVVYNRFKSVISQQVTVTQLIPVVTADPMATDGPLPPPTAQKKTLTDLLNDSEEDETENDVADFYDTDDEPDFDPEAAVYRFEPPEEKILNHLLPRHFATQVYTTLLESLAGEHGARMTAMDNATRNAGDMIDRLTLNYNRSRQNQITKELIEIISGAEAV